MGAVALLVSVTAVFGLLIGSFLNVVVWRVPRGESLLTDSHCPKCDTPVKPWQNVPVVSWVFLRGRCASCKNRISVRYPLVEIATAASFGLVAWWFTMAHGWVGDSDARDAIAWWLAFAAYLWFASITIALTLIDIDHQRLPDAIVLPSLVIVLLLLVSATALTANWPQLITTVAAAAVVFAFYFVIVLVYPQGMGGGDVKLAPVVGSVLGYAGWAAVAVGAFAGFLLGALYGIGLMLFAKGTRKTGVAFGPFMLTGAWIGIVFGDQIMGAYLTLTGLA